MMYMRNTFPVLIVEAMNFKMIELPYVKNELSMFILLPNDIKDSSTGLEQVKKYATPILYLHPITKKGHAGDHISPPLRTCHWISSFF